jgi:hypothetical protein
VPAEPTNAFPLCVAGPEGVVAAGAVACSCGAGADAARPELAPGAAARTAEAGLHAVRRTRLQHGDHRAVARRGGAYAQGEPSRHGRGKGIALCAQPRGIHPPFERDLEVRALSGALRDARSWRELRDERSPRPGARVRSYRKLDLRGRRARGTHQGDEGKSKAHSGFTLVGRGDENYIA